MSFPKAEQPIVDILSQVLPLDLIKYEILPRYRLPTDEEVEKGKRMFNRCLVELEYVRTHAGDPNDPTPSNLINFITFGRKDAVSMLERLPYAMLRNGLTEEILRTIKPSEVGDWVAVPYFKEQMVEQIKMRSLEGVIEDKLKWIKMGGRPKWPWTWWKWTLNGPTDSEDETGDSDPEDDELIILRQTDPEDDD